jgi:hypothetical protein
MELGQYREKCGDFVDFFAENSRRHRFGNQPNGVELISKEMNEGSWGFRTPPARCGV